MGFLTVVDFLLKNYGGSFFRVINVFGGVRILQMGKLSTYSYCDFSRPANKKILSTDASLRNDLINKQFMTSY